MNKDILAKALRLADRSTVKPHSAVVASPAQLAKTQPANILSERIGTRITKHEYERLKACTDDTHPISVLLRTLLVDYLDKQNHSHGRKKT